MKSQVSQIAITAMLPKITVSFPKPMTERERLDRAAMANLQHTEISRELWREMMRDYRHSLVYGYGGLPIGVI